MSEAERTPDGRYVVVNGRRWRATDPSLPEPLSTELRHALMSARRAVGAARRAGDDDAERVARDAVHDAKVALGERGHPWWEPPDDDASRLRAEATERTLARHR